MVSTQTLALGLAAGAGALALFGGGSAGFGQAFQGGSSDDGGGAQQQKQQESGLTRSLEKSEVLLGDEVVESVTAEDLGIRDQATTSPQMEAFNESLREGTPTQIEEGGERELAVPTTQEDFQTALGFGNRK